MAAPCHLQPNLEQHHAPLTSDKNCYVPLRNGQLCSKSIACKSHSMSAKRAVAGRSTPYDMLLAAHQKKYRETKQQMNIDAGAN
ncbi:SCA7, zinc-binding domain-containing protein, partial [Xylariaceae sp. FL1272]